MKRCFFIIITFLTGFSSCQKHNEQTFIIRKGNVCKIAIGELLNTACMDMLPVP